MSSYLDAGPFTSLRTSITAYFSGTTVFAQTTEDASIRLAVRQLANLPLKQVTVIVDDWRAWDRKQNPSSRAFEGILRWTLAEKQEWAREVKETLFQAKGA